MRGQILLFYIDQMLKIYEAEDDELADDGKRHSSNSQYGFSGVIGKIAFECTPEKFRKRMAKNPDYCCWDYEKSDDELEEEQATYAPSVVLKKDEIKPIPAAAPSKKNVAVKPPKPIEYTVEDKQRSAIVLQKCLKMVI